MNPDTILLYKTWFGDIENAVLGYSGTDADQTQSLDIFKIGDQWIGVSYLINTGDGEPMLTRTWVHVGKGHEQRLWKLQKELLKRLGIQIVFENAEAQAGDTEF